MRRPFIAGNWKMFKTLGESEALVSELKGRLSGVEGVDIVVAPPFTALERVGRAISGSTIRLSSQNLYFESEGAFTGEVSPEMVKDAGCDYAILGHSERRSIFNESDGGINRKVKAALAAGLGPILCVGESLEERESGDTLNVVKGQLQGGLEGIPAGELTRIVVAYEPVWAIGTGKTASPEDAEEVHKALRELLIEAYGEEAVKETRIIYGGSVKPGNVDGLMAKPNIDGALVGGASLDADSFERIVKFENQPC